MYEVVDCPFNREWYADMIGKTYATPPSYAVVRVVPSGSTPSTPSGGHA